MWTESVNERRWNALPQLEEYNLISNVKPGATVLALGSEARRNMILLGRRIATDADAQRH